MTKKREKSEKGTDRGTIKSKKSGVKSFHLFTFSNFSLSLSLYLTCAILGFKTSLHPNWLFLQLIRERRKEDNSQRERERERSRELMDCFFQGCPGEDSTEETKWWDGNQREGEKGRGRKKWVKGWKCSRILFLTLSLNLTFSLSLLLPHFMHFHRILNIMNAYTARKGYDCD